MWQEIISWDNIQSMRSFSKYKDVVISDTLFLHYFSFYDYNLNLIKNINFARCKQKNYDYDKFEKYIQKYHIAFLMTSKYYAWFVHIKDNQYICLYKSIFTYMIKGYIENNIYHPQERIDYINYQHSNKKDDLIINFLLNHLQATKLLISL